MITIAANNVIIDCNNFKVGGLAAGVSTGAQGIYAQNRTNVTIRNCVRGFWVGAYTYGGAGHLVEDNRVDSSTTVGLWIDGDNSIVRRNRIADTGGNLSGGNITGIIAQGDQTALADNVVTGVTGTSDVEGEAHGIFFGGYAGLVRGNYISSILPGAGIAVGMKSKRRLPDDRRAERHPQPFGHRRARHRRQCSEHPSGMPEQPGTQFHRERVRHVHRWRWQFQQLIPARNRPDDPARQVGEGRFLTTRCQRANQIKLGTWSSPRATLPFARRPDYPWRVPADPRTDQGLATASFPRQI